MTSRTFGRVSRACEERIDLLKPDEKEWSYHNFDGLGPPLVLRPNLSCVDTKDARRVGRHDTGESFVCCGDQVLYREVNLINSACKIWHLGTGGTVNSDTWRGRIITLHPEWFALGDSVTRRGAG
jgi:hypothetical protein